MRQYAPMTRTAFAELRKEMGSQRKVAALLGVGIRTVQRIENGSLGDDVPTKYRRLILGLSDGGHG